MVAGVSAPFFSIFLKKVLTYCLIAVYCNQGKGMAQADQGENKMTIYEVSANGTVFGTYEADSEQAARDICAQDAGYESESDMARRLEQDSELVAVEVK